MLACPVCGFRNPDTNDRCFRCQALLSRNQEEFKKSEGHARAQTNRDWVRGLVSRPLEWIGRRAWVQKAWAIPDSIPYRYPFTAGLLTIIWPGFGHFYLHQYLKGTLFAVCWLGWAVICVTTITASWSNELLLIAVVMMGAAWADAVATANIINGNSLPFRHVLALAFAFLFLLGIGFAGLQFFGANVVSLQKLIVENHPGYLAKGDRVVVNHCSYLFGEPRPGDLVLFDPQRFTMQRGDDLMSINIERYYQRIVGMPGDHVEKKGKQYYRNGTLVPAGMIPINGDFLPEFDVTVPAGSYFIPVTTITPGIGPALLSGMPIGYVGEPGYNFSGWPRTAFVKRDEIMGKALAVIDPPEHRKWL